MKQFRNASLPQKIRQSLANHNKNTVASGLTQNLTKSVLPVNKKDIPIFLHKYNKLKQLLIRTEIANVEIKLRTFQYM